MRDLVQVDSLVDESIERGHLGARDLNLSSGILFHDASSDNQQKIHFHLLQIFLHKTFCCIVNFSVLHSSLMKEFFFIIRKIICNIGVTSILVYIKGTETEIWNGE